MNRSLGFVEATSSRAGARSSGYYWVIALAVAPAVGAAARLYELGAKSIWLDEAFAVFVARQPLGQLMDTVIQHDTAPPLYFVLLHFWLRLGEDPFSLRLLSALLGVGSVVALYLLGRELAGSRVGVIAALLMALSPFQVWYGQEARMYSLLSLLCALSTYFLVRALKNNRVGDWSAYTLLTALALYTQVSAAFFVLAGGLGVIVWLSSALWSGRPSFGFDLWAGDGEDQPLPRSERVSGIRPVLIPWILSQVALVVLWIPWLPNFLHQGENYREFWIETPTLDTVKTLLFEFTSAYLPHWVFPLGEEIVIAAGLLLAIIALFVLPRRKYIFIVALFVVPVAAMYVVSQVQPIFLSRALIYSSAPYLLLVAAGLSALNRWRLGTIVLAALVLLNLVSLHRLYADVPKERWDLAASYVTERATSNELVLFVAADAQISFDYYATKESKPLEERGLPVDVLTVGPLEPRMQQEDVSRIDQLVSGRSSFWLVDSHTAFADPTGLARRHAGQKYHLIDVKEFEGIKVFHYNATLAHGPGRTMAGVGR